jgi:hypothetical protein
MNWERFGDFVQHQSGSIWTSRGESTSPICLCWRRDIDKRGEALLSYVAAFHRSTEPTAGTYSDRRRASDWANAAVVALVLSAEKGALKWHLNELA